MGAQDGHANAVCPTWEGGTRLLRDELSDSASGLVHITAIALHNFRVVRPAGFVRTKLRLAT